MLHSSLYLSKEIDVLINTILRPSFQQKLLKNHIWGSACPPHHEISSSGNAECTSYLTIPGTYLKCKQSNFPSVGAPQPSNKSDLCVQPSTSFVSIGRLGKCPGVSTSKNHTHGSAETPPAHAACIVRDALHLITASTLTLMCNPVQAAGSILCLVTEVQSCLLYKAFVRKEKSEAFYCNVQQDVFWSAVQNPRNWLLTQTTNSSGVKNGGRSSWG